MNAANAAELRGFYVASLRYEVIYVLSFCCGASFAASLGASPAAWPVTSSAAARVVGSRAGGWEASGREISC